MVNNKLTPMQEKFKNFRLEGKTQAETYYERKYVDTITEIKLYAQDVLLPTELTNE